MESISGKKPMAKYWMHTGFLTINGQKMSKSLNNFITIEGFLKRYSVQQLRFWIAKNLWHSPIDYSESTMLEVKSVLEKIEEFLRKIKNQKSKIKASSQNAKLLKKLLSKTKEEFYKSLADDFNTPKAFTVIFEFVKTANIYLSQSSITKKDASEIYEFFKEINKIFGIIDFDKLKESNIPSEVLELSKTREDYRKAQNWQKSDELRLEIEKYGYTVEDTKDGTVLRKN